MGGPPPRALPYPSLAGGALPPTRRPSGRVERVRAPPVRGGGRPPRRDREHLRFEPPHPVHGATAGLAPARSLVPPVLLHRPPLPPGDDGVAGNGPATARPPRGAHEPPADSPVLRPGPDRRVRPRPAGPRGGPGRARVSADPRRDRELDAGAGRGQQRLRLRLPPRPLARRPGRRMAADASDHPRRLRVRLGPRLLGGIEPRRGRMVGPRAAGHGRDHGASRGGVAGPLARALGNGGRHGPRGSNPDLVRPGTGAQLSGLRSRHPCTGADPAQHRNVPVHRVRGPVPVPAAGRLALPASGAARRACVAPHRGARARLPLRAGVTRPPPRAGTELPRRRARRDVRAAGPRLGRLAGWGARAPLERRQRVGGLDLAVHDLRPPRHASAGARAGGGGSSERTGRTRAGTGLPPAELAARRELSKGGRRPTGRDRPRPRGSRRGVDTGPARPGPLDPLHQLRKRHGSGLRPTRVRRGPPARRRAGAGRAGQRRRVPARVRPDRGGALPHATGVGPVQRVVLAGRERAHQRDLQYSGRPRARNPGCPVHHRDPGEQHPLARVLAPALPPGRVLLRAVRPRRRLSVRPPNCPRGPRRPRRTRRGRPRVP